MHDPFCAQTTGQSQERFDFSQEQLALNHFGFGKNSENFGILNISNYQQAASTIDTDNGQWSGLTRRMGRYG